jgi:NADH-quinone oxidoreductase subunit N
MVGAAMQMADGLKEQLQSLTEGVAFLWPEITLVVGLLLVLLFDLIFQNRKEVGIAAISISVLSFLLVAQCLSFVPNLEAKDLFVGLITVSSGANLFKVGFTLTALVALIMAAQSKKYAQQYFSSSEWLVSLFGLLLGAFLMTASSNLLMIYVSIEVVSISSYLLTGLGKGLKKSEAALKYLLYGAAASAVMLYGMSWLYGLTGSLDINTDTFIVGMNAAQPFTLNIAIFMVLAGVLFKLGAFPLHIWSPDVYESAPMPTVTVFSIVPKLAAVFVLFRLISSTETTDFNWQQWLGILAIGGMTFGNFSALWQRNAKRMLAYSSIAHAAFMLSGVLLFNRAGIEATVFYAFIYLIMNLAAFYLIQVFENTTGSVNFDSFRGLGKTMPYTAILLLVVMISLTGLPPVAGFNAKLFLFSAVYEGYVSTGDQIILWVFIFGLLNTVVSLFYYIRIPYLLFFKTGDQIITKQEGFRWHMAWGTFLVLPLFLLFFRSDWFVDLLNSINFVF